MWYPSVTDSRWPVSEWASIAVESERIIQRVGLSDEE